MSIFARYQSRFEAAQEEEMSVQEYLDLCKRDPSARLLPALSSGLD